MIKVSAATAHVLGIKKLKTDALPTTAYLMKGEKCAHDCSFCPQARSASSRANLLSRVTWGEVGEERVADGVEEAYQKGQLKRVCLQVVDSAQVIEQVKGAVKAIKRKSEIPICVSAKVKNKEELLALAETGIDRIGLALDAASERVFSLTKTGNWWNTLKQIEEAASLLPGRISTHLIVGLGETEEEMVQMLQKMKDLGVNVGLFAFTPVAGTKLEKSSPPKIDSYRRMQVAHYLLSKGISNYSDFTFLAGQLTCYGLTLEELKGHLKNGKAFETTGCPDCNRPYYNERPGGTIYNYPRALTPEELDEALQSLMRNTNGGCQ